MAKRTSVPEFGSWDGDNVGYKDYFDKVRENKGATAPPLHRPSSPNDPADNPGLSGGAPPSRPATSNGHRESQRRPSPNGQDRHSRSNSSNTSSDPGRGNKSKFAPPPQYHPRPSTQHGYDQHEHGHGHGHRHPPPAGHQHGRGGGGSGRSAPVRQEPRHQRVAPRARSASASPQNNIAPQNRQRPSAMPKFGAWDDQNGGAAAMGFTVQFDNVKRKREMARGAGLAGGFPVRRAPSPEAVVAAARRSRDPSFMSKMFGCFSVRN
ncbi:hypothetical protein GUJ93_ZPchr0012g20617 [Zizania palustris]|uniref:RIN4 pathogenic type III effector avirulence factor Avr cleavage site domain-containing protein n=1 Tax=Zizania palustris TaxID=103762 RepID=A0A8J6BVR5_ZIZPA|nr:hypothetical protein GUJ93_ZPchr0012g18787 [Zizania palustris]KAG8094901.1 hypothetical protein GUJ93_ZPchr0012g20617 [Zizania palustris]